MQVVLEGIELRRVHLPLAETFRTGKSSRSHRDAVVVQALVREGASGWSECVTETDPSYWPEYTEAAWHVLQHHLVPRILAGRSLREVRGHQMAKAALETAALDAGLRAEGRSVADFLGATRTTVSTGIALGIPASVDDLASAASWWRARGHGAFKLKIAPGWDIEPVRAVRQAVGLDVDLLVDANGTYHSDEPDHLVVLEKLADSSLNLVAIEQPFAPDDLLGHARLARRIEVPVCLDESIGSLADVQTALALGACGAVSLKSGRVGGLLETRRIHQFCRDEGVALRAGGMLEMGLGRALNLAVAALPGCTLPPDLGPSTRYFSRDITKPFEHEAGMMSVPDGPGLGVEPLEEVLDQVTVNNMILRAAS
jgi:O-succinylbenzoate synthase